MLNVFWRLLIPIILLAASLYAVFEVGRIQQQYQPLLAYLPYPLLLLAMLLAQQFNRLRLFAAAGIFLLTFITVQMGLQQPLAEPRPFFLFTALSLLLPINLTLLAVLPERGLWSRYGFGLMLWLAAQALLLGLLPVAYLQQPFPYHHWFEPLPIQGYLLSYAASLLFALALLVMSLMLILRKGETEAALWVCLLAVFLTLLLFAQAYISAVLLSCCALCLMYCLLRSSRDMAFRDDLTGLRNRRAFNEKLRSLAGHYVIATMDIDHFKKFNDSHGHEVGDDVLRLVAAHIAKVAGGGVPYRYGGEEFCVVFSGRQPAAACAVFLEQLRVAIEAYPITLRNQASRPDSQKQGQGQRGSSRKAKTVSVTISIGVAERNARWRKAEEVLKASDQALYKAKKQGRNCLVLA
ncbi:GGDEF domain-containing protein [Dasania sp. GY-MA-18]|uniref:diguanylate cyclase n=1 Tax=Dasania phycosphaerae TaxID=2950436 RepID=A0A9J6RMT8_9GAMM|nr:MULTISPECIES: GGDEF domain-containing protein [Dasania]MCR8922870.1 GGDEF domain-containing protein [Dasania sp. GY-MA-18]MCZ0865301.1 GGDEF domain-containing protein [Dasania phycosphaerae]MCZ0869026.1 GGDEF domain-containing protein [Dasania phycosphaerae]